MSKAASDRFSLGDGGIDHGGVGEACTCSGLAAGAVSDLGQEDGAGHRVAQPFHGDLGALQVRLTRARGDDHQGRDRRQVAGNLGQPGGQSTITVSLSVPLPAVRSLTASHAIGSGPSSSARAHHSGIDPWGSRSRSRTWRPRRAMAAPRYTDEVVFSVLPFVDSSTSTSGCCIGNPHSWSSWLGSMDSRAASALPHLPTQAGQISMSLRDTPRTERVNLGGWYHPPATTRPWLVPSYRSTYARSMTTRATNREMEPPAPPSV